MGDLIERLLGPSTEEKLRIYIGPRARNRIWEYAWMTQSTEEARNSYVIENYWNGRVNPTLQICLQKVHNDRGDLLPGVSKEQIYSIASVVRKSLEETRRDIKPTREDNNKLIISSAEALVYGIRKNGEMVDFYSLNKKNREIPYGRVRREVEIEDFDGSVKFGVKLNGKDMKLIFGLPNVPSRKIEGKYRIRKIAKGKIEKEERI